MMTTVTYASLDAFHRAHRNEIERALARAYAEADQFVRRLPCGLDGDAFRGETARAVWLAALAYRPELGVPWASWAAITVKYALQRELRRQDWVSERRRRLLHTGHVEEGGADLPPESLEARFGRERGQSWEEDFRPGPEAQALERESVRYLLEQVLALTPRDREVLLLRFWGRRTLAEIGDYLGVSTARAGQRVSEALVRLRSCFAGAGLEETDFREYFQ